MNDNPYLNEETKSGAAGMSGFMLGALVGASVALLFAPAAGNDTRRKLGETAKRLGSAARDRINEGRSQIQDRLHGERHGFESGGSRPGESRPGEPNRPGMEGQGQYGGAGAQGRREPVPSTGGTNPAQTGGRTPTTPGRTNP